MSQLLRLVSTELIKAYKSKVIWITCFAFTMLPLMGGFFMFILKNPEFAEQSGLLGTKAQLAGSADWPNYLSMLAQGIAIGGLFVFGFIMSWIFGREYTDRTMKDLLALPFPRTYMAIAKFITAYVCTTLVTLWVIGFGFLIGGWIGLPLWSTEVWQDGLTVFLTTSLLTMLLSAPVAFFSFYGRGYLEPVGFIIITIVLSQIIAAIGYGVYFPWAIPALFSNVTGGGNVLSSTSLIIVLITGTIGVISTLSIWRYADQNG